MPESQEHKLVAHYSHIYHTFVIPVPWGFVLCVSVCAVTLESAQNTNTWQSRTSCVRLLGVLTGLA